MRLFFGLSLPDDIRRAADARAEACRAFIPGSYVLSENHHITLAFLGDVPQERLGDAQDVLVRCLQDFPAPILTLSKTDYFGRRQNAILILRVLSNPMLDSLHNRLVCELLSCGLPADRGPFSPHITLARHARVPESPLPEGEALCFSPAQAHVFLSARDETDILRYTPLFSAPFPCP